VERSLSSEAYESVFFDHGRFDYFLLHQLGFVEYLQGIFLFILLVNDMDNLRNGETREICKFEARVGRTVARDPHAISSFCSKSSRVACTGFIIDIQTFLGRCGDTGTIDGKRF